VLKGGLNARLNALGVAPPKIEKGPKSAPKFFSDSFQFLAELRVLQPPLCIKKPLCEAVLRVLAGSCTQKSTPFHIFSFFMKTHMRNPACSDGNNLLDLVNKYMDAYMAHPDDLASRARAEKYAKIIAKTVVTSSSGTEHGQNSYFYDAAEGLITSVILLVAEFCPPETRHIVSVFKLIQDLLSPSGQKGKNQMQMLLSLLPPEHKARWFAGAAITAGEQAMASVLSTAMASLNAFLDSELEQMLCFSTKIDAEKFCREKSAVFVVLPEEDSSKYFMVSLLVQQMYREILVVADGQGGALKNRVMFFLDELGSLPKIESLELMFSAARSRRLSIVGIIQSYGQLERNYGKEGCSIILDNAQDLRHEVA